LVACCQGNQDHPGGLQTKLGCDNVGQFPLYQAAVSLMEEVKQPCHAALLVDVSGFDALKREELHIQAQKNQFHT